MALALYSADDYAAALRALFPRGRAWSDDPASGQGQVQAALAQSFERVDAAAQGLLVDAFPTTAVGLLPEWEETLGLPDPCAGEAPTISARQGQVAARLQQPGGQSIPFLIAFAAQLGFEMDVKEFMPWRVGLSSCTDPVAPEGWAHVWQAFVSADASQPVLECELQRLKPAHTILMFVFGAPLADDAGDDPLVDDAGDPLFSG